MRISRRIRTVLLIGGAALGLSACVYDPYPTSYGYGGGGYYAPAPYAYEPYAYGPAPSVSLGFSFADRGRFRRFR
jgi:hypothetical protein